MRTKAMIAMSMVLLALLAPAQEPLRRPNLAVVRFGDGSTVRVTLLQDVIDVQTKYGKLTVPVEDVRRIEFGLHIPPDVDQQIAQGVKRLASDVYKEREAAGKDLIRIGYFAIPALRKAARSSDQEVSYRAQAVIKQISDRVAPDLLTLREQDVVTTADFPVVGKIVAPTLKAHSPHFGEVALKLSELRAVQVHRQGRKVELVIDAANHGCDLDKWCDTGAVVDAGQRIKIEADGQVDLWPQAAGQYVVAPKGYNTAGKGGQFMAGALIGKIGEKGKAFYVGELYDATTTEEGPLQLLIVPSSWNNSSAGQFRVRVETDTVR